jgi:hypothetical protein
VHHREIRDVVEPAAELIGDARPAAGEKIGEIPEDQVNQRLIRPDEADESARILVTELIDPAGDRGDIPAG